MRLDEAGIIRLRELTRTEEDLQHEIVRTGHRLRELLIRYYPQMLKLCPSVDEVWFWDLLALVPLPELVKKLKRATIEQLLKSHRIRRLQRGPSAGRVKRAGVDHGPGLGGSGQRTCANVTAVITAFTPAEDGPGAAHPGLTRRNGSAGADE